MDPLLHKRSESLELNYSSGNSFDFEDGNYVVMACVEGNKKMLMELLCQGDNPNETDSKGKSGLHWAATRGRDDLIQVLLEKGANVCQADYLGNTALHYCGHPEAIRCLVEYGADLKATYV